MELSSTQIATIADCINHRFYADEDDTVEFMVFETAVFGQIKELELKQHILSKYNYLFNEVFVDFYDKFKTDETVMDPKDLSDRVNTLNTVLNDVLKGESKYSKRLLDSKEGHPSFVMISISISKSKVNKSVQFETKESLHVYNKQTDKYQEEVI